MNSGIISTKLTCFIITGAQFSERKEPSVLTAVKFWTKCNFEQKQLHLFCPQSCFIDGHTVLNKQLQQTDSSATNYYIRVIGLRVSDCTEHNKGDHLGFCFFPVSTASTSVRYIMLRASYAQLRHLYICKYICSSAVLCISLEIHRMHTECRTDASSTEKRIVGQSSQRIIVVCMVPKVLYYAKYVF